MVKCSLLHSFIDAIYAKICFIGLAPLQYLLEPLSKSESVGVPFSQPEPVLVAHGSLAQPEGVGISFLSTQFIISLLILLRCVFVVLLVIGCLRFQSRQQTF